MSTDYIVVGAGSAGSIVAARLSEDSGANVVVLEAGGTDRTTICRKPGMLSLIHQVPQIKEKFDWGLYCNPREESHNRKIPYPRGKVVGGSGAINGMVFVRGNKKNFDDWAEDGAPGWSYDDVLPYFKKMETFEDDASGVRGTSGPMKVTRAKDVSPVSDAFRHAVAEWNQTGLNDDYNGEKQEGGALFQLNQADGVRQSSSECFLQPALSRPNLRLEMRAELTELLFEGTRCVGVKYEQGGETHTLRAEKEVILCAGAVHTPKILMLAGIGPANHLREHGITCRADLPVGQNLHDHLFLPIVFVAPNGGHRGTAGHFFGGMLSEYLFGGGWFGRSVFEAIGFVKTDPSEPIANMQLHSLPWSYPAPNRDAPGIPEVDTRPALTVQPSLIYPKSRGELLLTSADPKAPPHIDPHFLEDPYDMDFLVKGAEITREILRGPAIAQEIALELEPGPAYESPERMRAEIPNRIGTIYHPVGTCRMGVDERAVVDIELRVRGIEGLRIVDASVMPTVTGGNTNAPTMMIAEKAAAMIRGS
ncbi:MAG: choline dehydrogenase [Proteobacteria bacterium]|nr:choline dehydrogenase [Pseudomonadota bacterium]MCP4922120.1 choline dehydrogenase [Pseudomonadota bacterium]